MMADLDAVYGPGSAGDSPTTARARLQQAWYRVHELGIAECGLSPDSGGLLRSYLPEGHDDANFVSETAYAYALERRAVKRRASPELTIDERRLRRNMLSSQPMCFSLFADLRAAVAKGDDSASRALAAMFPLASIVHVDEVVVEDVPTPISDYIHDRTGWDASVRFNGGGGLVTVETKYTDRIDTAPPSRTNPEIQGVARASGILTEEGLAYYEALGGFDQLGRNLLLTAVYAERRGIGSAMNYVLAPAFDRQAERLVEGMRTRLVAGWQQRIQFRTLDGVVAAALPLASGDVALALERFRRRYLDLSPVDELLGRP